MINQNDARTIQTAQNTAMNHAKRTLDPQWSQARKRFDQSMVNKGLSAGSEAYKTEFDNFNRSKNDAYNGATFGAMQTGLQAQNMFHNQGMQKKQFNLNELGQYDQMNRAYKDMKYRDAVFNASREDNKYNQLAALMGGVPVQGATPLNVQGAYQMSNNAAMNNYNAQMQSYNNNMSGLYSLGGAVGGALMLSDKDSKDTKKAVNHSKLAEAILNLPNESWKYKGQDETHIGTYAQDFNKAIGKGEQPMINQIDYNGAMLSALKHLNKKIDQKGGK